ncbi:MAG: diaminopimelate epimerase [Candidatus Omnitrophica bacterium]|nr:diaminopimelate epimerase [Candidatus Omnitrophota bacterium]
MNKLIKFAKLVGAGNDFVLIDNRVSGVRAQKKFAALAKRICDRTFGVGADGLLVLDRSARADVKMRIFNSDGSEAEMCGNGVRCLAYYAAGSARSGRRSLAIETTAGVVQAEISGRTVKAKLPPPAHLKLDIPLTVAGRRLKVNFINTGVPHAVIFVEGLQNIDVSGLGRQIRFHPAFAPAGTNVDFVEPVSREMIGIRTYERGVEAETLACGTGSTAAALVTSIKLGRKAGIVGVQTQSGEVLKIYFTRADGGFKDVRLEGNVALVYKGEYYV